uniref:Tf2-1-like SH3-like domain-containing protein n=1 Tax=Peronospora matthiolae TaxID=2874970 RepID=A0AAV1V885_9STRA
MRSETKYYSMLKNLPTNVVSAVFKTKLRPRFIGPFTVTAKKGLAYTLNLPRKLRTHPVFYVGLLKPYRDPSHVNLEALAPTTRALPRIAVDESASPTEHRSEFELAPSPEGGFASHPACTGTYPRPLEDPSLREPISRGPPPVHRPPPTLLDEHGCRQFNVEGLLKRRRRQG